MAECISTVESTVAGKLASAAIQVCCLLGSLKDDLLDLESNFKQIQADLHVAEKKQPANESDEQRLKRLKSASLEVENALDEANTEDMIQRMHGEMGRKYMLRAFFTSYNPLMVRFKIVLKLKKIREKLDKINDDISKFGLTASTSKDEAGIGGEILGRETCSLKPLVICGRDEEKKRIVDKICNQEICIRHGDNFVRAYAIWGMGGIGKTTLAQMVYNDQTLKFDLKCWVYVSVVFDVKQIVKTICGSKDSELDKMSLGELLGQLQNKLEGKKYFIIMDDVWIENKDMNEWEKLCIALKCGAEGSTVMVTTRNEYTAKLMAKTPELQHNVGLLSEEESWSLFEMLAFPDRGERENVSSELKLIGKEMVKKCNGLPLAVKTVGSLMLTKEKEVNEWQDVNDNFKWEQDDDIVLPALRLSYNDLPPRMKICFAYCCVFSKGEEMSMDSLIELWIANGFIPSEGGMSSYVLGQKFFTFLVQRSFFQDVVEKDIDTGVICKMHDLMHDLAQYVLRNDFAVIGSGKESITPDEVLHLSISCEAFEFSNQDLKKLRSVRSMLVFDNAYQSSIIRQISSHVYLRVLYLNGIESSTLPESICKLIHLRYLKISDSEIKVLPESIIYLQNLQTLILEDCDSFRELPKGLRYMRNLQRLDIGLRHELQHMPVGIKELTNLRRLSEFVVGKDDGARIGELGNLNRLGRGLTLSRLENVGGLSDAKSANLKDKTNLKSLKLVWWDRSEETNDSKEVVEGLEPNSGLQELTIFLYMGRVLSPSWLVKLVNLTSIQFIRFEKCEQLPPLGKLPSLKRIQLYHMYSLKCFHDDDNATTSKDEILFPSLQELHIYNCWDLVSLANNFPKLQLLKIFDCNKLSSLPDNFPKLQSLEIAFCNKLGSLPDEIQSFKDLNQITIRGCVILSRRYQMGIGEDWPKISHIPHLNINEPLRYEDEDSDENEDKDDDSETLQG